MEELETRTGAEPPAETPAYTPAEVVVPNLEPTAETEPEAYYEGDILVAEAITDAAPSEDQHVRIKAVIEAAIYITEEPLTAEQIAAAIRQPLEVVHEILARLAAEYAAPSRGLTIREVAGGYKMSTKAEHHEDIRQFVRNLQPAFKLSPAALETLAVIAYKQPITGPEILDIRGVQGAGVLKTLLDRKLISTAGRKNVMGKPILYKTTKEFLVQFGLSSVAELPTLKEFEELGRLALNDGETPDEPDSGTTGFGEAGSADAVVRPDVQEAVAEEAPEQEAGAGNDEIAEPSTKTHAAEAEAQPDPTEGGSPKDEAAQEVSQTHG